ncbi:tripartite tricarboxylate transporter substrate-binding protein [Variovorax ureilyticus]|uniref:tripartite tricarboxylate transporter substrate-binding protein n=1 Tax=Variovorax ureilyticus TaxID=1836198 RepID=UPI003D67A845
MNLFLRSFARSVLVAATVLSAFYVQAADFPTKPIKLIVPYSPGGSTDVIARLVATKLSSKLGQPVVVENKTGASEMVAASFVAQSPADGYTLYVPTMTGMSVNPILYPKLSYSPKRDFVPLALAATIPGIFVVNPNLPVKNMTELGQYLKKNPGTSYASAGNGTPNHLGVEMYKHAANVDALHVPYKGGAPAQADVMAGQVQFMLGLVPDTTPLIKSGKLRAVGIATPNRLPQFPDVPTVAESGFPGFEIGTWVAFVAPAATPKNVVDILSTSLEAIIQDPEMQAKLKEYGAVPGTGVVPRRSPSSSIARRRSCKKLSIRQASRQIESWRPSFSGAHPDDRPKATVKEAQVAVRARLPLRRTGIPPVETMQYVIDAAMVELCATMRNPHSSAELMEQVAQWLQSRIGHKLCTILMICADRKNTVRIYSDNHGAYPLNKFKRMGVTAWGDHVIHGGKCWIGRNDADMQWAFPDHELIKSLGLSSALSVPLMYKGECLAVLNMEHIENWYQPEHVAIAQLMIPFLVPELLSLSGAGA